MLNIHFIYYFISYLYKDYLIFTFNNDFLMFYSFR